MSSLTKLIDYGQSYWLDNLTRSMIKSGELKKRITKEGLRGQTSNPAIFYKAISESSDYNKQIEKLAKESGSLAGRRDGLWFGERLRLEDVRPGRGGEFVDFAEGFDLAVDLVALALD